MKLPIIAYGDSVLRKPAKEISNSYPNLHELIENMFETMYGANGVGLAAPQIGKSIRVFVIDASPYAEEEPDLLNFKRAFINPVVLKEDGEEWSYNEGCLSIPDIHEDINRPAEVTLRYFDENWEERTQTFKGLAARIIQHEFDHIEGKLFTDKLPPLRKVLLKSKLDAISKGKIQVDYKMKFPVLKKKR